jgi:hypothetical protein
MPFGNTMPPSHDLPRHRPDLPPSHTSFARNHGSPASPFAEDEGKFPRKDLRHAVKEEKDEGYSSWSSIARCDLHVNSPPLIHTLWFIVTWDGQVFPEVIIH